MTDIVARIRQAAHNSPAAAINWPQRGKAPIGYVEGMAVAFGRVCCKLASGDPAVVAMAVADTGNAQKDALTHYGQQFSQLGMSNAAAGVVTLRHLFVLMMGLGMRESSGQHCEGRDMSAPNTTADTAEAGLFQTSFNARTAHALLVPMFDSYKANPSGFVDIFKQGVHCSAASWKNWGTGAGKDFQQLSKECPAFAVEFTALALRNIRTHWGPLSNHAAGLRSECDDLFLEVQRLIDATPGGCTDLL
ncbi:MAG: hypothetical protein K2X72_12555 [Reyranella sp.]|nr:hypothetical protein [Reyranella sp.]